MVSVKNVMRSLQTCIRAFREEAISVVKTWNETQFIDLLIVSAFGISVTLTFLFLPSFDALFFPPLPTTSHFPMDAILDLYKLEESWELHGT